MPCPHIINILDLIEFHLKNGFKRLYPVNILLRCEHNLYLLWDRFKHTCNSQFLEIVTTSKEIISFYDHGVVVFRFGRSRNDLSNITALYYLLVEEGL